MTVQIRLFGAFRNYSSNNEVALDVQEAKSLSEIKAGLFDKLSSPGKEEQLRTLLSQSAVANETRVLGEAELVLPGMKLAILPPVCGG